MKLKPLIGPSGKIPILIRDDDTNFFTDTKMLESVYSGALNHGYKISLSVVPLQRGIDDIAVPPNSRSSGRYYSIADNVSLIKYVRNKIEEKSVEVIQHGLSHEPSKGGRGEFGSNLRKKDEISKGSNIIRGAFHTEPKFFVPPGEDISNENIIAVIEQGLVPIYRQTLLDTILRVGILPESVKEAALRLVMSRYKSEDTNENFGVRFMRPVIVSAQENTLTWSLPKIHPSHITSFESLSKSTSEIIKQCKQNRSPVCLINHCHLFYYDWSSTITKGDLFKAWSNMISAFDTIKSSWKTTFFDLYLQKIRSVKIAKTGSKITIQSDTTIDDFSLQINRPFEPNTSISTEEESDIATVHEILAGTQIILYEKN